MAPERGPRERGVRYASVEGHPFPIVWAIVGGIVLVSVANLLMRPHYVARYAR
jgi:hypothetical protein